MEAFLGFLILIMLFDIEDKLKKIRDREREHHFNLSDYLNKDVYIVLKNDNVTDSYLFSTMVKTIGKITDYDDSWFVFNYYNKNKKKNVSQYLRVSDLKSVNEIK